MEDTGPTKSLQFLQPDAKNLQHPIAQAFHSSSDPAAIVSSVDQSRQWLAVSTWRRPMSSPEHPHGWNFPAPPSVQTFTTACRRCDDVFQSAQGAFHE